MKYLIFIFLIAITLSTKAQTIFVDSIITEQSLKAHVSALAHDSMQGRLMNTSGNRLAEKYITTEFEKLGLEKFDPKSGYAITIIKDSLSWGKNIVGLLKGNDTIKGKEFIIFSAHYDHIGTSDYGLLTGAKKSWGTDKIYNGANDNATGVAALIELASYYSRLKKNEYTLLFVAFNAEELGLIGSTYFAEKIPKQKVKLVINLEMLGRSKRQKTNRPFITGNHNKKFIKELNNNLRNNDSTYKFTFFINDHYPDEYLEGRSDNFPFNKKDIPAYTIMLTSPKDKYYHSVDDELETIDFATMQQVVKGIALACQAYLQ
jgi:Zn-dependent M28 family amino/carboxypeptidase